MGRHAINASELLRMCVLGTHYLIDRPTNRSDAGPKLSQLCLRVVVLEAFVLRPWVASIGGGIHASPELRVLRIRLPMSTSIDVLSTGLSEPNERLISSTALSEP